MKLYENVVLSDYIQYVNGRELIITCCLYTGAQTYDDSDTEKNVW